MSTTYIVTIHRDPPGYSPGTWEYRVSPKGAPGTISFDGGYSSSTHAKEAGLAFARRFVADTGGTVKFVSRSEDE